MARTLVVSLEELQCREATVPIPEWLHWFDNVAVFLVYGLKYDSPSKVSDEQMTPYAFLLYIHAVVRPPGQ